MVCVKQAAVSFKDLGQAEFIWFINHPGTTKPPKLVRDLLCQVSKKVSLIYNLCRSKPRLKTTTALQLTGLAEVRLSDDVMYVWNQNLMSQASSLVQNRYL